MPEFDIRIVRLPAWAVVLLAALAIALGIALAVLAAGLVLILFPLFLVLAAIGAVLGRRRLGRNRRDRAPTDAIDVDYAVVEEPPPIEKLRQVEGTGQIGSDGGEETEPASGSPTLRR